MKEKFIKTIVPILIVSGILLVLILVVNSLLFTDYCSRPIRINNGTFIGTFEGLKIEKDSSNGQVHLLISDVSENGDLAYNKVSVKCTKSQLEKISKLPDGFYYLYYSNWTFDKNNGKLVGVYKNNPLAR